MTRQQRLDGMCKRVEALRDRFNLPTPEIVREAIDGVLHFRTGRKLVNAPKFEKKPVAHVFHKTVAWHAGSGWLGTVFSLQWDCDWIVKDRGLDITGNQLHDQLDSMALILLNGVSPAVDKWNKALGR